MFGLSVSRHPRRKEVDKAGIVCTFPWAALGPLHRGTVGAGLREHWHRQSFYLASFSIAETLGKLNRLASPHAWRRYPRRGKGELALRTTRTTQVIECPALLFQRKAVAMPLVASPCVSHCPTFKIQIPAFSLPWASGNKEFSFTAL